MSAPTAVIQACTCGSIGASGVRLCEEHHRYWNGDKELVSVSKVIRETWPLKKKFEAADPATLEHARLRGVRVDRYIADYVMHGRLRILAGEWEEVVELVQKFVRWWDGQAFASKTRAQIILFDEQVAGTCDFIVGDDSIFDLKCTYDLEVTYRLQMGAYAELYEQQFGYAVGFLGLLQATKRFATIQPHSLDVEQCKRDWRTLRQMWELCKRLT